MDHNAYKREVERRRRDNTAKFNQSSKRRLSKRIEKKIRTTMIGALARFEDKFGFLWGHGAPAEDLTPEESKFRALYEEVRIAILDNGNSQLRAAMEEINEYTVSKKKYRYEFHLGGQG